MKKTIFELSRSQQAVFKMEAFHLAGCPFYLGVAVRLNGSIPLDWLVRAAETVRNSMDIFHIGFETDNVEMSGLATHWHGIRRLTPHSEVIQVDFSNYPDSKQAFESWADRQMLIKEDLSLTPVRIFAVHFQQGQTGWFIKAHHAAMDGEGFSVLIEHLMKALEKEEPNTESLLFSVHAEGEQNYENSRRRQRDEIYWRSIFSDRTINEREVDGLKSDAPESSDVNKISCRYPMGDYRTLTPRSRRVHYKLSKTHNDTLRQFKKSGGSIFRLFFAAVAYTQMVIEDGNGALLQAPMLNRWSSEEKRSAAMTVAPVLIPVFRETGEGVVDCYHALKQRLQKAVAHSRYAPGARWSEFASPDWKRITPAFGVSYQTGIFRKEVLGAEVSIEHMQAVEALFATIHIHDRFEEGDFKLEADFRRIWSLEQCHEFLRIVTDYAMEAAFAILKQQKAEQQETEQKQLIKNRQDTDAWKASSITPIGIHLYHAFECYADNLLFKQAADVVTYRQGLQWINPFRLKLRDRFDGHDTHSPVFIVGRRTPEITLAYLACLIENITVVPVCPTMPVARLSAIARNSGAALCIYTEADSSLAERLNLPLLPISLGKTDLDKTGFEISSNSENGTKPIHDNPAYILYTSGSTGEPKGVVISPVALANYALAAKKAYAAETPFNAPLFTSFGFDLTQTTLLVPVLSGGFIQAHEQDIRDNPELLQILLADKSLTGVKCTPSHLSLLIENSPARINPLTFIVGGENLSTSLVKKALSYFPAGSKVINEYGPTETTVGCCICSVSGKEGDLDGNDKINTAVMPIGQALGKAEMAVKDSWGQTMPRGFKGEIWIGGPVLADGYLNNTAQTTEKFVHSGDGFSRWYRTGDLGLQDEQGVFHCLGRIDDEFKVRGYRIHPAEIEKAVEDVLVSLDGNANDSWKLKVLKLIVDESDGVEKYETIALCSSQPVPHNNPEFQLRLKAKIPDAWMPTLYCAVQPWPINANGKVDTVALTVAAKTKLMESGSSLSSSVHEQGQKIAGSYQLPVWLNEAFLKPIWPQSVDFTTSFLEQGGDSIKAIRLVALLTREGIRISASELLTLNSLGSVLEKACIEQLEKDTTDSVISEKTEANWVRHLPSVSWFRQQDFKYSNRLQQGMVLELKPALCAEAINAAISAVKARHKIFSLRANQALTEFYFDPSKPDSDTLTEGETLASGESLADRLNQLQSRVSLETQPSVHAIVFDAVSQKNYLIWVCHHLICDVHSWIFLLDELDQAIHQIASRHDTAKEVTEEQGAFLWGKWLSEHISGTDDNALCGDTINHPAAVTVTLALSICGRDFKSIEQRFKAERSQLIVAALMEVMQDNEILPSQPVVLLENHGRLFSEAGIPTAWNAEMASAVGWFTGFNQLTLDVPVEPSAPCSQTAFLRILKSGLSEDKQSWEAQLGLNNSGKRPLICINDIGFGLDGSRTWSHFSLDQTLSGGFRHPDEKSTADFDILIRDCLESGDVWVELQLGMPDADSNKAYHYLAQLNEKLLAWCDSQNDVLRDPQVEHHLEQPLIPADFPLCQLAQSEFDPLIKGALKTAIDSTNTTFGNNYLEELLEATPQANGLLFHALKDGNSAYHIGVAFSVKVDADEKTLLEVWQQIQQSQPALRSVFVWEGIRIPHQIIYALPRIPFEYVRVDATTPPLSCRQRCLDWLAHSKATPFELNKEVFRLVGFHDVNAGMLSLAFSFHHILMDGWSSSLLISLWLQGLRQQKIVPLDARNYSQQLWQGLSPEALIHSREYWRDVFQHLPNREASATTKLLAEPLFRADKQNEVARKTNERLCVNSLWSEERKAAIEALCRRAGVTPASFIYLCWALTLAKFTFQKTIALGCTFSGRGRALTQSVDRQPLGLFINTVPLILTLEGQWNTEVALRSVFRALQQAQQYEKTPPLLIREEAGINDELYDSIVVFDNYPIDASLKDASCGAFLTDLYSEETTHFGLTLTVSGMEQWRVELSTGEMFKGALDSVKTAFNAFESLAEDLISNTTDTLIEDLFLKLNAKEPEETSLSMGEINEHIPDINSRLQEIYQRLDGYPQEISLIDGQHKISNDELLKAISAVQERLRLSGFIPGDRVAVHLEKGLLSTQAILAILFSGGSYCYINPKDPLQRKKKLLDLANCNIVLSGTAFNQELGAGTNYLLLDIEENILPPAEEQPIVWLNRQPEDEFYFIFTSGTTGTPKGISIRNESVANLLDWFIQETALTAADRVLGLTDLNFDPSVEDLFASFVVGATLIYPSPDVLLERQAFINVVQSESITLINFIPGAISQLIQDAPFFPSMRLWIFGGEELPERLRDDLLRQGYAVSNHYGPSETTVDCLSARQSLATEVAIGWPIQNVIAYCADIFGKPLPASVRGELWVGGRAVARGYTTNPVETAKYFVKPKYLAQYSQHPFYRTGDMVTFSGETGFRYLGRIDDQIKVNGIRIEPRELERVVETLDAVKSSCLLPATTSKGKRQWHLFVDSMEQPALLEPRVREHIRRNFPDTWLPSLIVVVDGFKRTITGKIDRQSLQEYAVQQLQAKPVEDHLLLANPAAVKVRAIWQEVLENERVGTETNFFEAGGNSIKIITLQSLLQQAFNREIRVTTLFEHPTIASFTNWIKQGQLSCRQVKETEFTSASDKVSSQEHLQRSFQSGKSRLADRRRKSTGN
ncbi:AMP-binding protein [Xenorhabdus koppenhoeferi]|uniref:Amino acid adenylation domain-containing protein n=1 Tax=Xenorhabdus koppenhoeferi TaxID=351659 RepID=A0A1I7EZD2_9GAMM|nr:AMP-binding protein [Xenorhabdus koppenhoeferi]SFU29276.1 amino acid adenylation domain-containing protein [Xenorhabdus koppenhoeferi]